MKLQDATDIKIGSTSASKVMLGTTQIWGGSSPQISPVTFTMYPVTGMWQYVDFNAEQGVTNVNITNYSNIDFDTFPSQSNLDIAPDTYPSDPHSAPSKTFSFQGQQFPMTENNITYYLMCNMLDSSLPVVIEYDYDLNGQTHHGVSSFTVQKFLYVDNVPQTIDLTNKSDNDIVWTVPQSFGTIAPYVFHDTLANSNNWDPPFTFAGYTHSATYLVIGMKSVPIYDYYNTSQPQFTSIDQLASLTGTYAELKSLFNEQGSSSPITSGTYYLYFGILYHVVGQYSFRMPSAYVNYPVTIINNS